MNDFTINNQSPNTEIRKDNQKGAILIMIPTIMWTIFIITGVIWIYLTKHEITGGTYLIFGVFIIWDIFFFSIFYLMYPGKIIIHADHIEYKLLEGLIIKRMYFDNIKYGVLFLDKENIYSMGLMLDKGKKFLFHGNIYSNEFNLHLSEVLKIKWVRIIEQKVDTVFDWYANPKYAPNKIIS